ncbi:MAG: hypothetical protein PHW02_03890 [bacterium]|nr:hypothetical protein [bacterium]
MKKILYLILIMPYIIFAGISFSGEGEALGRISLSNDPNFLFKKTNLKLSLDCDINENTAFWAGTDLFFDFQKGISDMSDLSEKGSFPETRISLDETYLSIKRFPVSFIDISVGRQKVTVGEGDVVSPVDIVCPDDLSDPLTFGDKVAKEILSVYAYAFNTEFALHYSPVFAPSLLFENFIDLNEQFRGVDYINDTVKLPSGIKESSDIFAVLSGDVSSASFSVFYGYTRTHTPLPENVTVEMVSLTSARADLEFFFPRMQTGGFSISLSAGEVGLWGDFSANYVSQTEYTIDLSDVGRGVIDTFSMKSKYFFNCLLGMDYTFPGGFYMNIQYAHGMRGEYGEEMMHDYIFVGTRLPLFNEKIVAEPLNMSYEISDFDMITKRGAIVAYPKITLKSMDNLEISAALIYVSATTGTNFSRINGYDGLELGLKYYF